MYLWAKILVLQFVYKNNKLICSENRVGDTGQPAEHRIATNKQELLIYIVYCIFLDPGHSAGIASRYLTGLGTAKK